MHKVEKEVIATRECWASKLTNNVEVLLSTDIHHFICIYYLEEYLLCVYMSKGQYYRVPKQKRYAEVYTTSVKNKKKKSPTFTNNISIAFIENYE